MKEEKGSTEKNSSDSFRIRCISMAWNRINKTSLQGWKRTMHRVWKPLSQGVTWKQLADYYTSEKLGDWKHSQFYCTCHGNWTEMCKSPFYYSWSSSYSGGKKIK